VWPFWPVALTLLLFAALTLPHPANARLEALLYLGRVVLGLLGAVFVLKWVLVDLSTWLSPARWCSDPARDGPPRPAGSPATS
jgi:hypothetical protein